MMVMIQTRMLCHAAAWEGVDLLNTRVSQKFYNTLTCASL